MSQTLGAEELKWGAMLETALSQPGKMGSQYTAFHRYSLLNVIHLIMQGAKGPVASYDRWKQLGRQVKRGAHAMEVIMPLLRQVEDEKTGEKVEKLVGFKPVRSAFDYRDTTGKELVIPEPPEWSLKRALGALAITQVPFESIDGNLQGYSLKREFAINPVAKYPLKTSVHEMGHIVLGHTQALQNAEALHRGIAEFQAEATALLVLNELGQLDAPLTTAMRGYIQFWLQKESPPDKAIQQVFGATERILRAGRLAPAIGHLALTEPGEL